MHNAFGWAQQRSITTRDWKYISSTRPELYDRKQDLAETNNLIDANSRIAANLHARLLARFETMIPGQAKRAQLSDAAKAGLAGLGYLDVGNTTDGDNEQFLAPELTDPKDMSSVLNESQTATKLITKALTPADYEKPIEIMQRVTKAIPQSYVFHASLAKAYLGA